MRLAEFRFGRLVLYFFLVSIFLFLSGHSGQYLINEHGMEREIGLLLQGVLFTGATLIALYFFKRKNPNMFKRIGLKDTGSPSKFIIGLALPFILLILGILTAYLLGGIKNISFHITPGVLMAIGINIVTAFLYEAFPEEVFLRGLIFEELRKKFSFTASLFLQPLIFVCVPVFVTGLGTLFFGEPFSMTSPLLLYAFGIALQLYREYTGSLWMSMIFHVIYLEVARYISMGSAYNPDVALLTFDEVFGGFMALYLSFFFMVILSIVVLAILLRMEKKREKRIG